LQNKPNFKDGQMNVNIYYTNDYKNFISLAGQKTNPKQTQNKPKTNPIAERVKLMQSVYLQRIMKKNAAKGYEKTNPIQTQFKPSSKAKMSLKSLAKKSGHTNFNKPKKNLDNLERND